MPIISARDNKNSTWNRNEKKQTNKLTKTRTGGGEGVAEAIVKGWELNDYVVHLS